jgi:hypothetical protein
MSDIQELELQIAVHLADTPDDMARIMIAANKGMDMAIQSARKYASDCDRAMLAALSLMTTKKCSRELKDMLLPLIKQVINRDNASPVERAILAMSND